MDQELADSATNAPDKCCIRTHQMAPQFYMKWLRHIERMMSHQKSDSVNRCVFTLRTTPQTYPNLIWNNGDLGFFFKRLLQ